MAPILGGSPNWHALALFAVLSAMDELFQVDLYGEGTVSISVAVSFAAAFIAGIRAAVAMSMAIGMVGADFLETSTGLRGLAAFVWHYQNGGTAAATCRNLPDKLVPKSC